MILDLSKLSPGTRFNVLDKIYSILTDEAYRVGQELKSYPPDSPTTKEMEGWRQAASDVVYEIATQRKKEGV
jgi:hypothetical protein